MTWFLHNNNTKFEFTTHTGVILYLLNSFVVFSMFSKNCWTYLQNINFYECLTRNLPNEVGIITVVVVHVYHRTWVRIGINLLGQFLYHSWVLKPLAGSVCRCPYIILAITHRWKYIPIIYSKLFIRPDNMTSVKCVENTTRP